MLACDPALGSAGTLKAHAGAVAGAPCMVVTASRPVRLDLEALMGAHAASGALVTVAVRPRTDEDVDADVLVADDDGRVIGVQPAAHPDEALSDLVDAGIYVVSGEALDHIGPPPSAVIADLLPALLAWDAPVHVHPADG